MSRRDNDFRDDLPADLEPGEAESLILLAARLAAMRPPPRPTFRGDLGRDLAGRGSNRVTGSPARAARLAASYVGAGLFLMAVAAIGVAGVGPFAS